MQQYTGRVIRVIWPKNLEQQQQYPGEFAIVLFRTNSTPELPEEEIKVKGQLRKYKLGTDITVSGEWETHPKHGTTFHVATACLFVPRDKKAIFEYMKVYVHGVGEKTLKKVTEFFGEDTLEVIRTTPDRLGEITGVSVAIRKKIVSGCKKEKIIHDVAMMIDGYQVPINTASKIYEKFGEDAQAVLDESAYNIVGLEGVGFKSADRMEQKRDNFQADSIQRVAACELSYLGAEAKNGHSCAPKVNVIKHAMAECGVDEAAAENALASQLQNRTMIYEKVRCTAGDLEAIFLPAHYYSETKATEHFNRVLYSPSQKPAPKAAVLHVLAELEELAKKKLTDEQKAGVERAFTSKISVITGKPGTGKTLSLKAAVAVAERLGLKYGLCAPTGRAAKNMTNSCGKKAVTIHRLLEFNSESKCPTESPFDKNEDNQLGFDILFVDETSMVDSMLLRALMEAVPNGCRVVFIGDDNQLPSVGAGRCLHDIIRSGVCSVTELHIIHRQAQDSNIILNAHRILNGKMMEFPCNDISMLPHTDCAFLEAPMVKNPNTDKDTEDSNWVQATIKNLCSWYLPHCGLDPIKEVQILSPRKDGPCGVNELNRVLQQTLNSKGKVLVSTPTAGEFREGDRVMVIKNDYDLNVFNGDIGVITGRDLTDNKFIFDFYGETVKMTEPDLQKVVLAYAVTVHKSQGSEYKAVILLILKQHGIMMQRNLLYTGVTRAKQRLTVVGSKIGIKISTRNVKPVQRNTLLWHRLSRLRVNTHVQPAA